jgi:hypothetical protein
MNYTQLLLTSLLLSPIHSTQASPPPELSVQQRELVNATQHCDAATFKDRFTALATQFQSTQEKAATLDLLLACAQDKKAEKMAELDRIAGKRIQHRASLYKAAAQITAALFFGLASIIALGKGFLDTEFADKSQHETMTSRCATLIVVPMTVWFAYLAQATMHRALHYSDVIKQDIQALDEIITFIQTRVRSYDNLHLEN